VNQLTRSKFHANASNLSLAGRHWAAMGSSTVGVHVQWSTVHIRQS